jgi:hypothetical protein
LALPVACGLSVLLGLEVMKPLWRRFAGIQ